MVDPASSTVKALESSDLRVSIDAERYVGVIELGRAPNNFLDITLLTQIVDALNELDRDPRCRAVVLCADGKHFCAGRDFSSPRVPGDEPAAVYGAAAGLLRTVKPFVAAVQGAAIGAGLGLALTADFRLASTRAYFSANFVTLGLHPGFGLSMTLPRLVGTQRAAHMLYTGRRVGADDALLWGLVEDVVTEDRLLEASLDFAATLAHAPADALQATRQTLRGRDFLEAFERATAHELSEQNRVRDMRPQQGSTDLKVGM